MVPAEFLVIPESAIHHDDKDHPEEVEPPRLFSAAVHPTQNIQNNSLTAISVPDDDHVSNTRAVDTPINQIGSDSPRKLGRSRTDTMVFSEAFSVAEDSSRSADGSDLLGSSPMAETELLTDLETRIEDLDDEDIGDARSDMTLTGSLSPPVETLPLISLEDTPAVATSDEVALHDAPLEPPPRGPLDETPVEVVEASAEEPAQVTNAPGESVDETSSAPIVEPAPEETSATTSEALAETTEILLVPEERGAEPSSENDDPIPLLSEEEPKGPEAEGSEVAAQPEGILELHEPPPSEPIPPESESDITDEVGADEQRIGGDEEAV